MSPLPGGVVSDPATQQNLDHLTRKLTELSRPFLELVEQEPPAAPAANSVRIFATDNGGKTQLVALFATGEEQVIAEQP